MNLDDVTPERVREVLRHLARDRTPGRTPLASLTVVSRSLEDAGFQNTPVARQYEVGRLLAEIVERELATLRQRAQGPSPSEGAEAALVADFGRGLRELESWSAVYHLYLRPDLDLGLKGLTSLLDDRHRRTVQRRLRRGVVALTGQLQAMERQARLAQRDEALAARLPLSPPGPLLGVDSLLRRAAEQLGDPRGGPALALRGPGGIGKTALAQCLARRALGADGFVEVAWLTAGPDADWLSSAAGALGRLGQAIGPEGCGPEAALAGLRRRRTLVVVDGVDAPERAAGALRTLAGAVAHGRLLLTGRSGWSAWGGVRVLDVPVLSPPAAVALLRHEAAARGLSELVSGPDEVLAPLLAAARGHPLALRLAAAELRSEDPAGVARDMAAGRGAAGGLCRQMWEPAWQRAGPGARAVTRAAAEIADGHRPLSRVTLQASAALRPEAFTRALAEAVELGLLEPASGARASLYRPALFLRRYLRQQG